MTPRWVPILAAALAVCLFGAWLGRTPVWDPDEGRHAEVAREVHVAADWPGLVVPRLNGEPYYDKPILYYWLAATGYALAGVGSLGARLPSAVGAGVTLVATTAWTLGRFGPGTARWTALVLATTAEFLALARFASLDMTLTLWVTLGILAVDRAARRPLRTASLVPAAVCAGLGVLTKGFVALVLIGGAGLLAFALRGALAGLRLRPLVAAVATLLAVTLPWHVAAWIADPAYLHAFVVVHQLQRFTGGGAISMHPEPVWFFLPVLLVGGLPWTPLLPVVARGLAGARRTPDVLLCAGWVALVVGFFSLSRGKLGTYILPAFPPLAVLVGVALARLEDGTADATDRRLARWGLGATAVLLAVAALVAPVAGRLAYDGALAREALLALLLPPAAAGILVLVRRDALVAAAAAVAGTMIAAVLVFHALVAPGAARIASTAPLGDVILAAGVPADTPVVAYGVQAPALGYTIARPLQLLDRPRMLARLVEASPLVLVVTSPKHLDAVRRAGVTHVWASSPRRVLLGTRPPGATAGPSAPAPAPAVPSSPAAPDDVDQPREARAGWGSRG